jgi:DNA-directed RNA polymerase specialized sigma24 family protein
MNKEWVLTQAALDNLLAWLSPNRDEAGAKYEAIRARLIKLFTCRGCAEAEDLADETINRVISKLGNLAEDYRGEPALYFYGVAKKVRQEYQKQKFRPAPPPAIPRDDVEEEYACLEQCMRTFPPDQKRVLIEYYQGEKRAKINNRKRLAREMGIALNALRIRAHRLRAGLQRCVEECLGRAGKGETYRSPDPSLLRAKTPRST